MPCTASWAVTIYPSHCACAVAFFMGTREDVESDRQPSTAIHRPQPTQRPNKKPVQSTGSFRQVCSAGPVATRPATQRLLAHRFLGSGSSIGSSVSSRLGSISSSGASVLGGVSSVMGGVLGGINSVASSFLGSVSSLRSSSAGIGSSVLGSISSSVGGVLGSFNSRCGCRCWRFHRRRCWCGHSSFFLLAASSQSNSSHQRCDNQGFLHFGIPNDGGFLWNGPEQAKSSGQECVAQSN